MSFWRLKLFYDGECPFCRRQVEWLKRRDRSGCLAIEDISALGFDPAAYGLCPNDVQRILHGIRCDGKVVRGMEAVREAYRTAGLGWLAAPTRLPVLRTLSDCLYGLFARYRAPLGRLFGQNCSDGSCHAPPRRNHILARVMSGKGTRS